MNSVWLKEWNLSWKRKENTGAKDEMLVTSIFLFLVYFKHIYFTSNEKQVLEIYTNLSRFCFLGTTPVLKPNMWTNENLKVNASTRESNFGPYDYHANTLPHDQGHDFLLLSKLL